MFGYRAILLLIPVYNVAAQSGVELDAPMLVGGGIRGPGAMLRFGCSQIVIERLDPLVNPGMNPSAHMHQIVGSNAFNASMPYTDISQLGTCTSCHFTQDLSNYWTANLYFKARNNTYKRIPQTANQFNAGDQGGLTVYYTSSAPNASTAFTPGFRMFTGDPTRRTPTNQGKNKQQCYRCYPEPNWGGSPYPPCMDPVWDTEGFPRKPCPGGIRSNIIFPQCWDGKNLDSPNHSEHMAHPVGGPVAFPVVNGSCPAEHPVKVPQVMFEVMWDTTSFNDLDEWPVDGSQPLYLSNGDNTGYAQHADYIFGWESDSLQRAMDNHCYLRNCTLLTEQPANVKNLCRVRDSVGEDVDGWMKELPGGGGMR